VTFALEPRALSPGRPFPRHTHSLTKLHGTTLLPKIEKFIDFARAGSRTVNKVAAAGSMRVVGPASLSVGRWVDQPFSQTFK
jgi:hypothetical protein